MTLIDLSVTISGAAPEQVYELLTDGAKFGEVTGLPGEGGGAGARLSRSSAGTSPVARSSWCRAR